jgi:DNA-binding response OmpR family regulator
LTLHSPRVAPATAIICVHEHSDALRMALEQSLLQAGIGLVRSLGALQDLGASLSDGAVEVLLMDLDAPGHDVLDLCSAVRSQYPGLGLLLCSARYSTALLAKCLDAGADQLIPKPVAVEELTAQVRRLVTRNQVLRASQARPRPVHRVSDTSPIQT